jgi:hypothetical protein
MNTQATIFQARRKVGIGVCTRLAASAASLEDGSADDRHERKHDADYA